jgi:hypothetical protein
MLVNSTLLVVFGTISEHTKSLESELRTVYQEGKKGGEAHRNNCSQTQVIHRNRGSEHI